MEAIRVMNIDYKRYYKITCSVCGSQQMLSFDEYRGLLTDPDALRCLGCDERLHQYYHSDNKVEIVDIPIEKEYSETESQNMEKCKN